MEKLNIICVDDQREVLSAVLQDLEPLSRWINIEDCESADEALDLMDDLDAQGEAHCRGNLRSCHAGKKWC